MIKKVKSWLKNKFQTFDDIVVRYYGAEKFKIVSQKEALGIEAYYSAIQDQASTLGALPVKLYRKNHKKAPERLRGEGKYSTTFNTLCIKPCDFLSIQQFLEFLVISYRMNGVFYALPFYNKKGQLEEILPFFNQRGVQAYIDVKGEVFYRYVTNDGFIVQNIPSSAMFIVKGITLDGYTPVNPLYYQARMLNIAIAQDDTYHETQTEGITSQMALTTDNKFTDQNARERLREDFEKMRGVEGRSFIPIFEQGLKPFSLKLTPQELDLLNQRQFTIKRICAMLDSMPHRIGAETIKSSDKIYELDEAQFKKWNPLVTKIERELSRVAGSIFDVKLDRKSFYAGSPFRLVEAVEREVKGGLASIAEGREDLGRDYIEGTENIFCIQSNNCIYGSWDELKQIRRLDDAANTAQINPNDELSDQESR